MANWGVPEWAIFGWVVFLIFILSLIAWYELFREWECPHCGKRMVGQTSDFQDTDKHLKGWC